MAAGMAMSAATAVARLGHPVALWANTGNDALRTFLISEAAREGIQTSHIRIVEGAPSAIAAIIVAEDGERMVIPYYDPILTAPPDALPVALETIAAVLVDVRWPGASILALETARLAGLPAVLDLDLGPSDVLRELAARATHIIASTDGARVLTGVDDAKESTRLLASMFGADVVVVTAGAEGCYALDRISEGMYHIPAFPVTVVDTNAAGDVFHGAYVTAIAEGQTLREALLFASAAAAIKCTRAGGRLGAPARREVVELVAERSAALAGK